jgi:ribose transport system permease protein
MIEVRLWLGQRAGMLLALGLFILMFGLYVTHHPVGLNVNVATTAANKGVILALVAMAQTFPVLTGGLDLSVGMIFILTSCIASHLVTGGPLEIALGILIVLGAGVVAGAINGAIVVYGRLQPIITTLATGAIQYGLALLLRPVPGGNVDPALADALTYSLFETVPTSLVVLLAVIVLIWIPFRLSETGRACYAVGSSEAAAYMSGVAIDSARLSAYVLSGLVAAIAGLMLSFVTLSGEASAPIGGTYTLNSIAAVVIGGTSLFGGAGGAIGSVFGAFVLRTIEDLLFVFDLPPLWQPLFQGVVLLVAVSLGAARVLRVPNRLELFS